MPDRLSPTRLAEMIAELRSRVAGITRHEHEGPVWPVDVLAALEELAERRRADPPPPPEPSAEYLEHQKPLYSTGTTASPEARAFAERTLKPFCQHTSLVEQQLERGIGCHGHDDGDCFWSGCPMLLPGGEGNYRHCPLDYLRMCGDD